MPSEVIRCQDCGVDFEFTERDQEFYKDRGFDKPKRCKPCRIKKKSNFNNQQRDGRSFEPQQGDRDDADSGM